MRNIPLLFLAHFSTGCTESAESIQPSTLDMSSLDRGVDAAPDAGLPVCDALEAQLFAHAQENRGCQFDGECKWVEGTGSASCDCNFFIDTVVLSRGFERAEELVRLLVENECIVGGGCDLMPPEGRTHHCVDGRCTSRGPESCRLGPEPGTGDAAVDVGVSDVGTADLGVFDAEMSVVSDMGWADARSGADAGRP